MAYTAQISRTNPTALLVIIDQSTSMSHKLEFGPTKSAFLADVLNKTLYTLITTCSKADGVRDYFHVGVIAYSGNSARNGFEGPLAGQLLRPISEIAKTPIRIENRTRQLAAEDDRIVEQTVKFPIWFEPRHQGKTSMCAGLGMAHSALTEWSARHPRSYPGTVLHITDGHPTDGDPEAIAEQIKMVTTEDGSCLLLNLHVDVGTGSPCTFPNDERGLPDKFSRRLFRMSSELPVHAVAAAKAKGYAMRPGAKGFVFNAGLETIVDFFDIGTRPAELKDVYADTNR